MSEQDPEPSLPDIDLFERRINECLPGADLFAEQDLETKEIINMVKAVGIIVNKDKPLGIEFQCWHDPEAPNTSGIDLIVAAAYDKENHRLMEDERFTLAVADFNRRFVPYTPEFFRSLIGYID